VTSFGSVELARWWVRMSSIKSSKLPTKGQSGPGAY
jgi:hypothetical protein